MQYMVVVKFLRELYKDSKDFYSLVGYIRGNQFGHKKGSIVERNFELSQAFKKRLKGYKDVIQS